MSKNVKKRRKPTSELTERDLENTFFVPMKRMNEVIEYFKPQPTQKYLIRCDYNLLSLKHERSTRECYDDTVERYSSARHKSLFVSSCYKALYAHDWDRLLYILKRVPRWRFESMHTFHTRVLSILLMYHPESQERGYFNEYLHMVWGCRLDQDKKAIQKTILTLRKRMYRASVGRKYFLEDQEQRKQAFAALAEKDNDSLSKEG